MDFAQATIYRTRQAAVEPTSFAGKLVGFWRRVWDNAKVVHGVCDTDLSRRVGLTSRAFAAFAVSARR